MRDISGAGLSDLFIPTYLALVSNIRDHYFPALLFHEKGALVISKNTEASA
jgi:hypothetical protein